MRSLLLPLLLSACPPGEGPAASNGLALTGDPVDVAVHAAPGAAPLLVLVRQVDAHGAAVGPAGEVQVTIDEVVHTVAVDDQGFGTLTLDEVGVHAVDGVGQDTLWVTSADLPDVGLPGYASTPEAVLAVGRAEDGALGASGAELWWSGAHLPAHPVVTLPGVITDLRRVSVDDDGFGDVVVTGGNSVVLLRGRPDGSLGLGFGLEAPGWTAVGADVGDLDGDGLADLLIDWETPTGHRVQVWSQQLVAEGGWSFVSLHERSLPIVPQGIAIARDRDADQAVATWLVADANWQRMIYLNGGFQLTGPQIQVGAIEGSSLRGGGDMNGDGTDELLVIAPRVEGAPRGVGIWDLGDASASHTDFEPTGATLAPTGPDGDLDGDGRADLVIVDEGGRTSAAVWREGRYLVRDAATVAMAGPIGVADRDADGILDLAMGGTPRLAWWSGTVDADDDHRWSPDAPGGTLWARDIRGHLLRIERSDADELALVARREDGLYLEHHRTGGAPERIGAVRIADADQDLVDMAHCGGIVWIQLTGGRVGVELAAGRVSWSSFLEEGETDTRALDCHGDEVAFVDDSFFSVHSWDGTELVAHTDADHQDDATWDIAFHYEGDRWKVRTCVRCIWLPGPDGETSGRLVEEDSAEVLLAVQDMDGDGVADLIRRDGAFVDVLRQMPDGSLTPMQGWHAPTSWLGAPVLGDAGGGRTGLWFARPDALVVSHRR